MIGNRITLYSVTNTDIASKGGSGTKHGTAGGAVVFLPTARCVTQAFFGQYGVRYSQLGL